MATVFKAVDRQTGQKVALKLPHLESETNARTFALFAREAAVMERLDHPAILKIIPVAEKSRPYIVMEYLEGETLYDILQRRPLAVCEAVQLASRLCGILEYMHRHNVVHCDLNPSNIILSDDGSPHIIDFGIASAPGWFSPKAGTPEYMAPEQIRGDRLDSRADIYATGALLYELVTGTRPFLNAGQGSVPVLPRELNSDVSEQIEEIILHAMAPNPRDRYGSAAAMQAELDFPGTVQVTGIYKNPRKASAWPKRLRLAGVVLSLAAVPFILFYLFLLMFQRQLAR